MMSNMVEHTFEKTANVVFLQTQIIFLQSWCVFINIPRLPATERNPFNGFLIGSKLKLVIYHDSSVYFFRKTAAVEGRIRQFVESLAMRDQIMLPTPCL